MTSRLSPAQETVSSALSAELAARAWDAPPALYAIGVQGSHCQLLHIPVPATTWALINPADVLAAMAADIAMIGARPGATARPGFYGVAFRFEAWDLLWGLLQGPARHQAQADLAAGRLHARPDRLEARYFLGTGRDGTSYEARQYRWQDRVRSSVYLPGREAPQSPVHDALRIMTAAAAGASREDPGAEP
jgi:hypothetical protein